MEDADNGKKPLFGSREASDMFHELKRISTEMAVLKVYDLEEDETSVRIKIFNSWMIVRDIATGAVSKFERDYSDGGWVPTLGVGVFAFIPLWPIRNLAAAVATNAKGALLAKLYRHVGMTEAQNRCLMVIENEERRLIDSGVSSSEAGTLARKRHMGLSSLAVAKGVFSNTLFGGYPADHQKRAKKVKGYVSNDAVYNGLKGFRAAFHRLIREPELFRALIAMNHRYMTVSDYLYFAANAEGVLKVWKERRNLVPLLPYISSDRWSDDDLFSKENWTSSRGALSRPGFAPLGVTAPSQAVGSGRLTPFSTASAHRWLMRARSTVVRQWCISGMSSEVAEIMAQINLPKETSVVVTAKTVEGVGFAVRNMWELGIAPDINRSRLVLMFRAFAAHWEQVRHVEGYRGMVAELVSDRHAGDVLDFMFARGFGQGLPARNSTWQSLATRSRDWHHQMLPRLNDDDDGVDLPDHWTSHVGSGTVEGCLVRPLDTVAEVEQEGLDMRHCVGGYARKCARGRYRVYSIVEPSGTRATLGITLEHGTASIDQVRGVQNSRVSKAVMLSAAAVVERYAAGMSSLNAAPETVPMDKAA